MILPLALAKVLLLPLGALVFLLVLLLFGAFGLAVAMGVIGMLTRAWGALFGTGGGRRPPRTR